MTRKEEIEKASVEYQLENKPMAIGGDAFADMIYKMNVNPSFVAGAEWADANPIHYGAILEEFEKNRLEHCDSITEEQYNLESDFVTSHLEKHHRIPTFLDAIEYGIEQGKKEAIDKIKSLIKEWELHTSTEAKYRIEAYRELLDVMKTMEEQI